MVHEQASVCEIKLEKPMMKLVSLRGNGQRLDGGAMFGNAPKALWCKWMQPDEHNRIPLTCRALLLQCNGTNVLLETGIGNFFDPRLKERYGVVESHNVLLESLAAEGLSHEDIDWVILSHLHFDHAGGLLSPWQEGKPWRLLFPNAQILVGQAAWERAVHPHPRDRASFVPEMITLLQDSGRLRLQKGESFPDEALPIRFHFSDGHTPGMMLSEIDTPDGPVVFAADLIPGVPWVHLPITMGYDRFPEKLVDEKKVLLESLVSRGGFLFFTHDPEVALGRVNQDEKGRFRVIECQEVFRKDWK
jgi:glyoxylase-like metal-dependent hydrolase (beta-lactamase superfamily II)